MEHLHTFDGRNQVHVYRRKYLGQGRYFQRGICQNINEGDTFISFTAPKVRLTVDRILNRIDSKGKMSDKDRVLALYEAELTDSSFKEGFEYTPLMGI